MAKNTFYDSSLPDFAVFKMYLCIEVMPGPGGVLQWFFFFLKPGRQLVPVDQFSPCIGQIETTMVGPDNLTVVVNEEFEMPASGEDDNGE